MKGAEETWNDDDQIAIRPDNKIANPIGLNEVIPDNSKWSITKVIVATDN